MGGSSKSQTVGYKYYVGMHMVFCHGPIDKILNFKVDSKEAWSGNGVASQITIDAPELFGGESREGGVQGVVDIEMGGPTQLQNSYLVSRIGSLMPAFRGVVGAVFRQFYMGMNPYLKNWSVTAKRTKIRQDGIAQWYLPTCEIPNNAISSNFFNENFTDGLTGWSVESGFGSNFNAVDGACRVSGVMGQTISRLSKTIAEPSNWNAIKLRFKIESYDSEDAGVFDLYGPSGNLLFNFTPARDAFADSSRRAHLSFLSGESGLILSDSVLPLNTWFQLELSFDQDSGALTGVIRVSATGEIVKVSSGLSLLSYGPVAKVTLRNETGHGNGGVTYWDNIEIIENASADMNPAHIIRECLTDPDWGMGYQDADIDEDAFEAAANVLFVEGFGMSLLWDRQTSIEDFIKEVVKHIDAVLFVDRETGKFVLNLVRSDFDEEALLLLDQNNIEKISDFSRPTAGELTNSVTVQYWDSKTDTDASVTIQDIALVQMQNATINTTIQYPGITNKALAIRIAQRDLKTLSTPLIRCTIYANNEAGELKIGGVFKLTWPDYDCYEVVMRVTGIAYGDGRNNRVRITATQDAFSLPDSLIMNPTPPEWVDPNVPPQPILLRRVFEVPYLELVQQFGQTTVDAELTANNDVGYYGAAAIRPQSNAINAQIYADDGSGFQSAGALDFCPGANLAEDILQANVTFAINGGVSLQNVSVGSWCQIDEEIMAVVAIDEEEITVKRGCLDTVPFPHDAGASIFFWDTYGQSSPIEYVASDEIAVRLLTVTGSGQLLLTEAATDVVEMASRAIRPYPPANLEIEGEYYPANFQLPTVAELTWNHRDRTQQTSAALIGEGDGNIGPEAGTTYEVSVSLLMDDATVDEDWLVVNVGSTPNYEFDQSADTPPGGAIAAIFKVTSIRAGYRSWQSPQVSGTLFSAPFNVVAEYVPLTSPFNVVADFDPDLI